ncbi:MAG: oligosaccharide flippase family protein [Eubacteriales bacterium]|nr:oligosaccharide flippase family protein [Eubacteriales bacterium]
MLKAIRNRLERTDNIERSSYLWNMINAMLSAGESPIMTLVLTRSQGVYDAGIFSIAYAVGTLMLYVGQYGFRKFQSSDIREKYSFSEYYGIRIITCIVMMLAAVLYCLFGVAFRGYDFQKFIVILMVNALKCVQAFTDVVHGRMQQVGRLDAATKASSFRYLMEILSFSAGYLVTRNLVFAICLCVGISVVTAILTSMNVATDFCQLRPEFHMRRMWMMMVEGFPLFLSLFLNMYLSNAPKYAIDAYLTEEIQATYNIIFMPAFVVQLIVHFIFNPILTSYAEIWAKGEISRFIKAIRKQMLIVLGLTVLGLAIAATIGIPVLSWMFGMNLAGHRKELIIVMIGGGMLAYSVFFNTVITIVRMHRTLIYSYGAAALAAFSLSGVFVRNYGMLGATVLYATIMTILTLILGGILWIRIRKEIKKTS